MSLSYYLIVYVPEDSLECVKKAIFMQKAGRIGCYACCAWQTQGQGQFLPLDGAKPVMGQVNQIEKLNEGDTEENTEEESKEEDAPHSENQEKNQTEKDSKEESAQTTTGTQQAIKKEVVNKQ